MAFVEGYLIGLSFIIFIGPVFFTLLKSTLQYSRKAGFGVATGIVSSDILAILLCSFGAIPLFENETNQFYLGIVGSAILFFMGLKYAIKPVIKQGKALDINIPSFGTFFLKGFMVNFINPFVFIVWIGIIGYGHTQFAAQNNFIVFISATLLGIFSTDCLKVLLAHLIKPFVQTSKLIIIYRIIGIGLIIFAARMLYHVL